MNDVVLCKYCGSKNRIRRSSGEAVCGQCKTKLEFTTFSIISISLFVIRMLGLALVLTTIVAILNIDDTSEVPISQTDILQEFELSHPEVPISPGITYSSFTSGLAPFSLVTSPGEHYFIKIYDYEKKDLVLKAYIIGGEPFEILMPLGKFQFKYAYGEKWYGEEHYFGPYTKFQAANRVFEFSKEGNQVSGAQIKLISVRNGNLPTTKIGISAF